MENMRDPLEKIRGIVLQAGYGQERAKQAINIKQTPQIENEGGRE